MNQHTYTSWAKKRIEIANKLNMGECGGTYIEAAIILCATINGMAAIAWNGEGIDKKRFIEIIKKFSPDQIKFSIPLLSQDENFRKIIKISNISFYLTEDNDKTEEEILKLYPEFEFKLKNIKKYSYPYLLYEQVRCNLMHEYMIGKYSTESDPIRKIANIADEKISYINKIKKFNRKTEIIEEERYIHFPIEFISKIVENIAKGLDSECLKLEKNISENLNLDQPKWWVEIE